jgi:hypothetical protein
MSLWRKRKTSDTNCDTIAPNVHHNEQKHDNLPAISIQMPDLSIKSKKIDDDDDIQSYVKPWVGLTEKDIQFLDLANYIHIVRIVEARLKELNA